MMFLNNLNPIWKHYLCNVLVTDPELLWFSKNSLRNYPVFDHSAPETKIPERCHSWKYRVYQLVTPKESHRTYLFERLRGASFLVFCADQLKCLAVQKSSVLDPFQRTIWLKNNLSQPETRVSWMPPNLSHSL